MPFLRCPSCNFRMYFFGSDCTHCDIEENSIIVCGGIVNQHTGCYIPYFRLKTEELELLYDERYVHYGCHAVLKYEYKTIRYCDKHMYKKPLLRLIKSYDTTRHGYYDVSDEKNNIV